MKHEKKSQTYTSHMYASHIQALRENTADFCQVQLDPPPTQTEAYRNILLSTTTAFLFFCLVWFTYDGVVWQKKRSDCNDEFCANLPVTVFDFAKRANCSLKGNKKQYDEAIMGTVQRHSAS